MTKLTETAHFVATQPASGSHAAGPGTQGHAEPGGAALVQAGRDTKKVRPGKAAMGKAGAAKPRHGAPDADATDPSQVAPVGLAPDGADSPTAPGPDAARSAASSGGAHGGGNLVPYLLGGLAVIGGGAALAAGGGSSGGGTATPAPTPTPTPVPAPTLSLAKDTGRSATDGITNNTTISVTGLQSGAKWEYSTDGGKTWAAGSGSSFTLKDGSYAAEALQARQTDSAGTVSAAGKLAAAVTIDTTIVAPTIDPVTGDDVLTLAETTGAAGVTVTGKAEANASVDLTWRVQNSDKMATATVIADANGNWSYTFKGSAVPDAHALLNSTLTAVATDPAGNVSSVASRTITTDPGVTVQGRITAGAVIPGNDLTVNLYSGTGKLLAAGVKVAADGSFQASNLALVKGDVLVAVLLNGAAPDYTDEATGLARNLSAKLFAAAVVGDHAATLNVNPLTTLAAQLLGLGSDGKGGLTGTADAGATRAAYQAVAKAFGLAVDNLAALAPEIIPAAGYPAGTPLTAAQQAGLLLAVLSGLDATNGGNSQQSLDSLAQALGAPGSTGLGEAGVLALLAGAQMASGKLGTALISLLAAQLASAVNGSAVTIGTVAGDDVINGAEGNGLTITGTVADGATAVSLALGSATVQASISGTTWSYTLTAEDLAALGADGPLLVRATATLADGTTATAQRAVLHETSAPALATIDAVLGNDIVGSGDVAGGVLVSGTAEAWSSVTVQWAGAAHTVTADAAGHWQWRFDRSELPPTDGASTITAQVVDRFGNAAASITAHQVVIDLTAPAAPIITAPGRYGLISPATIKGGVTVSGTGEAGATVSVGWDSTHVRTAKVDDDGHWQTTFTFDQLPPSGTLTFTATQTDAARNTSASGTSDPVLLVRSFTGLVLAPVAGGDGVSLADAAHGVAISGLAAAGSQLTITWEGGDARTATADADGYWRVTYDTLIDLPLDGTHRLTVSGTDASGAALPPVSLDVVIDTVPPAAPTLDPVAVDGRVNQAEKAAGVTISGTAQEAGVKAWVTWGGITHKVDVDPATLTWTTTFKPEEVPADADATKVSVKIVDAVGNESQAAEATVLVLTNPPAAPTLTLASDTGDPTVDGSATDGKTRVGLINVGKLAQGGTWEYSTDGGQSWKAGSGTQFTLDEGAYAAGLVQVRQTDAAGNLSQQSTIGDLIIQTAAPTVTVPTIAEDGVINAQERADGVAIRFSVPNVVKGVPVTVTLTWKTLQGSGSGTTIGQPVTLVITDDQEHVVTFSKDDIPDGDLNTQLTFTATDIAGNTAKPVVITVPIKTSPPSMPAVALANDLGFSSSDGITNDPTMKVSGLTKGLNWQYSADGGATWQDGSETSFQLADGTYKAGTILVRQVDLAGNPGAAAAYNADLKIDTSTAEPTIDPIGVINAAMRANGVTITGTAELGARITLTINGHVYTAADKKSLIATAAPGRELAPELGQWSITLDGDQVPGDGTGYTVTVSALDVAGNTSAAEGVTAVYSVDTVLPPRPTVDPLPHSNAVTAQERAKGLTFTGTTAADTAVQVVFNGITRAATVTGTTWSVTFAPNEIPADTAEGATTGLLATAISANRNSSLPKTVDLVIDSTTNAPTIAAPAGPVGARALVDGLTLTGEAEAHAIVTLSLGGQSISTTADANGQWKATFAGWQLPADGDSTVSAVATDRYGNRSAAQTSALKIDTAPPSQLSIGSVGNGYIKAGEPFTIVGKGTAGALVHLTLGGKQLDPVTVGANGEWKATVSTLAGQTADSEITLTAYVADAAGNVGPALEEQVQVLGSQHTGAVLGLVAGDDRINASELAKGFRINGYADPGSTGTVTGFGLSSAFKADASGLWTIPVSGQQLADGAYTVTVHQDGRPDVTRTIVIDTHAPDAPTIDDMAAFKSAGTPDLVVTAGEKATGVIAVNGHAEAYSTVQVSWGKITKFVLTDFAGNWTATFTASELPASGTSTITAVATDQAGNVGTASSTSVTVSTALAATDQNHTVQGIGNGDELSGTDGADTFVIPDLTFRTIDGGAGTDLLRLDATVKGKTFDLTILGTKQLQNIEAIDLSGGGANHLVVNAAAILADTGGANSLIVTGVAGERVTALGFTSTGGTLDQGGLHYAGYSNGSAMLWVDTRIDQVVL